MELEDCLFSELEHRGAIRPHCCSVVGTIAPTPVGQMADKPVQQLWGFDRRGIALHGLGEGTSP